jgi:hypothetical protein
MQKPDFHHPPCHADEYQYLRWMMRHAWLFLHFGTSTGSATESSVTVSAMHD